ncbi:hypothetical protein AMJ80_03470 [bacterium SM23_31]|nr:MAG: hypothetical protein AMJ80_03470 [bacterium SM23_31]
MLRDIIKKEILETITSPKFVFTFLLCTILILLSVVTGINNYKAEKQEYDAAFRLNRENLESQPSYMTLAGIGTKINKPPQVLSTIVSGIQQSVGRVATVNIAYDPNLEDSKYNSNPIFSVFGALDLSFIVKIVLSLFAILFTFDAIVGEKERGTLKLTLSNPVPRDRIILGKTIGGFISLLLPLIIPLMLGILILMISNISLSGEDWGRLGLIFLLFLFYLSVFFTLGLFVSTLTQKSSTSFLILLFIWVTFVTIIPKAAVMTASQVYPIPSVHEVTAEKDAYLQDIQTEAMEKRQSYSRENPFNVPQSDPEYQQKLDEYRENLRTYIEELQQDLTRRIDEKNAALEADYQSKKDKQRQYATNISRISPASALMFGSMRLAKTGINAHDSYLKTIKEYKREFTVWVNERMMQTINMQTGQQEGDTDLSTMPQHQFQPERLSDSISGALSDFIILIGFIIVFFVGAYVSFIRYDVR